MIKILKIGEVSMEEVFARVNPTVNVESIVTEIIDNVRKTVALYLFMNKYAVWELRTYYNQNTKIEVGATCFRIHGTDKRLRAVIPYLEKLGLKEAE